MLLLWVLLLPALMMMVVSCHSAEVFATFGSTDVFAIAFPPDLPPMELEEIFRNHGIDGMMHENNLMIPLTDFAGLKHLPLSEFSRRVQSGDPRHTPLSSVLVSSFTAAVAGESWRIWYVPASSPKVYKAVQDSFMETGGKWAWDAQLPLPAFRFLWVVWLAWIAWLLITRQVKDSLYHVVLILAWLPLAFYQSLSSAALMVVGQGLSASLGIYAQAIGRRRSLTSGHIYRLSGFLAPFPVSMLCLVMIDTKLLLPAVFSGVLTILALWHRDSVLNLLGKKRLHPAPPFRLILQDAIPVKIGYLGLWTMVPLALILLVPLIVPFKNVEHATYRIVFPKAEEQWPVSLDYSGLIASHVIYQEALTWGRLGEASWQSESYSRPYRFHIQDERIVRAAKDDNEEAEGTRISNERDKALKLVLEHTRGGTPMLVSGGDVPGIRAMELDSLGVVFYIMALAPFCVLGLHRVSQSRRRTVTSYTNRQVA
jgi:hypothetical protein